MYKGFIFDMRLCTSIQPVNVYHLLVWGPNYMALAWILPLGLHDGGALLNAYV